MRHFLSLDMHVHAKCAYLCIVIIPAYKMPHLHTAASCATCSAAAAKGSYPWQNLSEVMYRGQNHEMVNTNASPFTHLIHSKQ